MNIQKIRVMQLKDEYINTLEGQTKLQNIVDNNIDFDDKVEYEENSSNMFNIAVASDMCNLYSGEDIKSRKIFHDFFLGDKEFKYTYSVWEVEMKTSNPTKEQIIQHIVDTWYYPVDNDEAEDIAESYVFHDNILLRFIPADRVKEIFLSTNKQDIMNTAKELEKELNKNGVFVGDLDDYELKLIKNINNILKKSVEENTGVLYVIEI